MKTFLAIFLTIFAVSNSMQLPKSLKICQKSDPDYSDCLNVSITSFILSLASGIKSLGILPVEPMAVERIKIGESNGPVSLKQDYRNVKIHGLTKDLTLENYKIDFDKLILYSDAKVPKIELIADYDLEGQVLVFPIHGNGDMNITILNLLTKSTIQLEKYDKDGETYVRVTDYVVNFHPGKIIFNYNNLFDGDKALGAQLNSFINENSDLIFKELQDSFEETFGLIFKDLANKVFSHFPMKTLFPE